MAIIGFIGLGTMGSRMAANLLEAGHEVRVYNRSLGRASALVRAGARQVASPREAAKGAEVIFSMVWDDSASRAIWTDPDMGVLGAATPGQTFIECSTLSHQWVQELGRLVSATGVTFHDGPVLGSRLQAELGRLVFLMGGDEGSIDRLRALLAHMGCAVHALGPVGSGALMKLAVNAFLGVQTATLGELIGLVDHAGLRMEAVFSALMELPVMSPFSKDILRLMQARAQEVNAPIDLIKKDLVYVHEAADSVSSSLPITAAALEVFSLAIERGLGAKNISGVVELYW